MLKFIKPDESEREVLKDLCRYNINGTEAFTFLCAKSGSTENNFWCGKNEDGVIETLIFDNGNYGFLVFGEEYPREFADYRGLKMIYSAEENDIYSGVEELENARISEFYKMCSGSDELSFDDKSRYVYSLRCKNMGLCRFFGITENGKLVCVAAVTAMNEKYALIGNVFTLPQFRNRGFAEKCVGKCVEFSLSVGKTPFLLCEPQMVNYYKRLGFELINE